MSTGDFSWKDAVNNCEVVIPQTPETAVYTNEAGGIVIRQHDWPEDDTWVYFDKSYAVRIAKAILACADLDMEIVHVSQIRVQNGAGEVLQPFPDQATVDAVNRAADLVEDDKDDEDPAERKRKAAAERQRRRREKLKGRDNHAESHADDPNECDADDSRVTTAPAFPEFDLQDGGPLKALAN
jgi:hypothetical protein